MKMLTKENQLNLKFKDPIIYEGSLKYISGWHRDKHVIHASNSVPVNFCEERDECKCPQWLFYDFSYDFDNTFIFENDEELTMYVLSNS